ncbi:CDP-glycerol glycerophosphotransferase family protein [Frigoribacterium sp. CG_9.8]|uniref:CDP-glycerol glycerophosphotransferase family protein n=1 Tax=Frigoribacterium sp. CG_9.8 TaxID=2787733 RepID=UPI0018CA34A0|nr:CDP-glycerol glycerophosphotransferase family protein [Frigoribacterium sp. CG_9.8]MBG6107541.1 CDP-glycerol glycerophosphotransferase (TagB/SpsB family) [Frigoribacterium sp. CG_9.8]
MTPPSPAPVPVPVPALVIDTVVVTTGQLPAIVFEGPGDAPAEFRLIASRQMLPAQLIALGSRWSARVPLLVSNWNGPLLPARSGRYSVHAAARDGSGLTLQLPTALPASQLLPAITRVSVTASQGSLAVTLAAPLSDRERGHLQQASLESDYRTTEYEPLDAVFFESFFGQNASCNPLAIDRAIARLRPDIARYWSVADASVPVPDGAVALLEGSAEWWRIRGSARLLVINDWLRKRYRSRRHQTVLQTWHGTMLKKLALSRVRLGLRPAIATLRERARWDILLAQNPYSRGVFRRAYAFTGSVWEEGYPRDDVLVTGGPGAVRARLGIPDGVTVLLYAPTWRDDRPDQVDHLDVSQFAGMLGNDYVTLIRGHSRTLVPGSDVHAPNVLDVTGYPDVSELFLVADALITDYSSVMFDFTVTGKPVFFFTPDLEHYARKLRGFYFDLVSVAPGPVVSTAEELVALVRDRDAVQRRFADRYRAWRVRFNPRDDGRAADRVVQRLLAEGIIR